jgi:hypothetical protein
MLGARSDELWGCSTLARTCDWIQSGSSLLSDPFLPDACVRNKSASMGSSSDELAIAEAADSDHAQSPFLSALLHAVTHLAHGECYELDMVSITFKFNKR